MSRPHGATSPPPYPAPLAEALRTIRPAWHVHASCTSDQGDLFFSDNPDDQADAKAICRSCPVRRECAIWALDSRQEYGVWGGLTPDERDQIVARKIS
jgi:WhiB family redox-sensing transcriptional regulator